LVAYSTATSRDACAIPRACEAIPMRPASVILFLFSNNIEVDIKKISYLPNVIMAILNPKPGSPKIFPSGIEQSSNIKLLVEEPRIPSLSSFLPNEKPEIQLLYNIYS